VLPAIKIRHLWKGLLQAIEKVQNGFTAGRKLHLAVQVDVHAKVIAQRTIGIHLSFLANVAGTRIGVGLAATSLFEFCFAIASPAETFRSLASAPKQTHFVCDWNFPCNVMGST